MKTKNQKKVDLTEYVVESINDKRYSSKTGVMYLIKWIGYKKPTWESVNNLKNLRNDICTFESNNVDYKYKGKKEHERDKIALIKCINNIII